MMLLAALLAAAPITPIDATADEDVRCFAVAAYATGTAKTEDRAGLMGGTMYFLGRINARLPELDLPATLRRLLSDEQKVRGLQADAQRCGAILQRRGAELEALGKELQGAAKAR